MSIYDISYNLVVTRLLPPARRTPVQTSWLNALLVPVQWCRDLIMGAYVNGSDALDYDNTAFYDKGTRVRYIDNGVYECIQGTPSGIAPGNEDYWYKVLDSWIGLSERMMYRAQKILYEYALNKYFRIPDDGSPQIYITNNNINANDFLIGGSEPFSSGVTGSESNTADWMGSDFSLAIQYNYTIHVPIAVFNSLGSSDDVRVAIIKAQADKYNVYGMIYNVVSY